MSNTLAIFETEQFYHVYNRSHNKEILFRDDENRNYFLRLVQNRLSGYVKFYAYALLGNHFHFAISVSSEEEIELHINEIPRGDRRKLEQEFVEAAPDSRDVNALIVAQWSRVFNSYAQAINKRYQRQGHLFHTPFKRSLVRTESKFTFLIYYIHHNARKHGLVKDFLGYAWHSYEGILSGDQSLLEGDAVLEWFGGREAFIEYHDVEASP